MGEEYNRDLTNLDLMGRGWENVWKDVYCINEGLENYGGKNVYNLLNNFGCGCDIIEM